VQLRCFRSALACDWNYYHNDDITVQSRILRDFGITIVTMTTLLSLVMFSVTLIVIMTTLLSMSFSLPLDISSWWQQHHPVCHLCIVWIIVTMTLLWGRPLCDNLSHIVTSRILIGWDRIVWLVAECSVDCGRPVNSWRKTWKYSPVNSLLTSQLLDYKITTVDCVNCCQPGFAGRSAWTWQRH